MQAIQFSEFGGPEVLGLAEVPDPEAGPGQLRIKVRAAGVNPIDWKLRNGMMGGDLPRGVGLEVAGIVDGLGDAVTGVAAGDRVFGPAAGGGGMAELALVETYASIPPALDFAGAAVLPIAVETAARTLDLLGVAEGQTLVINGASGGVGIAAVQFARRRGARVIGTAGADSQDYLRSFGAEPTTYGAGLAQRLRELAPGGVDRALDAAGGGVLPALVEVTGHADHVVTIVDFQGAQETGVRTTGGPESERAWYALGEAADLIEAGQFSMPVAQTFALNEVADAQRLSESGHPGGKLVVIIG